MDPQCLVFTCPFCGGHYFGRDVGSDEQGRPKPLPTVKCHGSSSEPGPYRACKWRGVWPKNPQQEPAPAGE